MSFLAPLALLFLLVLPAILLVHLLRGRRPRLRVPAAYLWAELPAGSGGRGRWRLPPLGPLLLLQLVAALALALALARPGTRGAPPRHLAVVLDASASMQATDVPGAPNRFEAGRARALSRLAELAPGDLATVVRAGTRADVLAAAAPPGQAAGAIEQARAGAGSGAVREALALATSQLAATPDLAGELLLVTDGALPADPVLAGGPAARGDLALVGGGSANQAVVKAQVRPGPTGRGQEAYVELANYDSRAVRLPLVALADDAPLETRTVDLPPDTRVGVTFLLPPEAARATFRLDHADALRLDDSVEIAVSPDARPRTVLLVTARPSAAPRRALEAIAGVKLRVVDPTDLGAEADRVPADVTVLDGTLPAALPAGPLLVLDPPVDAIHLAVQGPLRTTAVATVDAAHPLLQGVDAAALRLDTATLIAAPAWARTVLGASDGPLVLDGRREGRPVVVFAFDAERAGLDKALAFPLLVSNAVSYLLSVAQPPVLAPGARLTVPAPASGRRATLVRPDGGRAELPSADGELRIGPLDQVGRYTLVEPTDAGERVAARIAVNLADAAESDIRPRLDAAQALVAGTAPTPLAASALPQRTNEWWRPLVLGALALLALEWLVFARRG